MNKRIKRSAAATAELLIINASLYGAEKGRDVSRFRISREGLRTVSGWKRLSQPFMDDLKDEFLARGWKLILISDTEIAFIVLAKISVWPKIGIKRLANEGLHRASEDEISGRYEELFPQPPDDESVLSD